MFGNRKLTRQPNGSLAENGCGKMNDFTYAALRSIRQLGCNAVWYTGVIQQASATDYSAYGIPTQNPQVLKGKAGSPYAITDYYSVSCDLAVDPEHRMYEFEELIARTHKVGLKAFIDFVPNHVARQYCSVTRPAKVADLGANDRTDHQFNPQNNFYYCSEPLHLDNVGIAGDYHEEPAKATGNDVFHAWPSRNDWYETVKLNYGVDYCGGGQHCFDPRPDTWDKMLDILLYWASMGVDGFRCDMAFMVPVEFWHWAIGQVKKRYPRVIFIAEIYDPALYRSYLEYGRFDYLYDKVGLYDTLRAIVEGRESASAITRCWQSLEGIQDRMVNFLENHDEQRLASDFFAGDALKGKPAVAVSCLMNTNPFMIYFGQELGERGMDAEGFSGCDGRTTIFDYWALESLCKWAGPKKYFRKGSLPRPAQQLRDWYQQLLNLTKDNQALQRGSFYDLTYCNFNNPDFDVNRQYAFMRRFDRDVVIVVANFDADDKRVKLNIPLEAWHYVGIVANRKRHFEDLMTGHWNFYYQELDKPFEIEVKGYDVAVIRFQNR